MSYEPLNTLICTTAADYADETVGLDRSAQDRRIPLHRRADEETHLRYMDFAEAYADFVVDFEKRVDAGGPSVSVARINDEIRKAGAKNLQELIFMRTSQGLCRYCGQAQHGESPCNVAQNRHRG